MGHFGEGPFVLAGIRSCSRVCCCSILGRGLLAREPDAVANPFYLLAPSWLIYPLVGLATIATVIASQAFTQWAFSPPPSKRSTWGICPAWAFSIPSAVHIGQIYVPVVDWLSVHRDDRSGPAVRLVDQLGRRLWHCRRPAP